MNLDSVHGSIHGFVHGVVHGLDYGLVHGLVHGTWFIVFFLNMVDYSVFFPPRSTLSLDTKNVPRAVWVAICLIKRFSSVLHLNDGVV